MTRNLAFIVIIILVFGAIIASASVHASATLVGTATATFQVTPTFDIARLVQPPTAFPPAQADNGTQTYWGMCMACHGD
jgi:cytochrome c5